MYSAEICEEEKTICDLYFSILTFWMETLIYCAHLYDKFYNKISKYVCDTITNIFAYYVKHYLWSWLLHCILWIDKTWALTGCTYKCIYAPINNLAKKSAKDLAKNVISIMATFRDRERGGGYPLSGKFPWLGFLKTSLIWYWAYR